MGNKYFMNDFVAIEEEEQPDLEMFRLKKFFDLHWSTAAWERKQWNIDNCLQGFSADFRFPIVAFLYF